MRSLSRAVFALLVPLTLVSGLVAATSAPATAASHTRPSHTSTPHASSPRATVPIRMGPFKGMPRPGVPYRKLPLLGAAGQRMARSVAGPGAPGNPVPTADPPYPCTPPHGGDRWTDPDTGENLVCRCFYYWVSPTQIAYDCEWILDEEVPDPSTWIDLKSGLYMDVEGVSKNNGARIHQWTYTGAGNQWWGMNTSSCGCGTGWVNSTSVNSGKCLGVGGGSLNEGASVVQWSCLPHPDQTWAWIYTGATTSSGWPIWNILNDNSGMCLGISGGSTSVGAYAIQWGCNGNADQAWY